MEFERVVRARRMVRSYRSDPVAPSVVDDLIDLARRAPSAGNTQGVSFVVYEGSDAVGAFWHVCLPEDRRHDFPWPELLSAPVIILPVGDSRAYVSRYAEPDKARTGLGESADQWPMEYWHVDAAMAAMTLLHAAVDRGLGALFFGLFGNEDAVRAHAAIPEGARPIGAIALGRPAAQDRPSGSLARGRRRLDEVVHRGGWSERAE